MKISFLTMYWRVGAQQYKKMSLYQMKLRSTNNDVPFSPSPVNLRVVDIPGKGMYELKVSNLIAEVFI